MRVVKDGSGRNRILVAAINALIQMTCFACLAFSLKAYNPPRTAIFLDANQTVGPANMLKMSDTLLFGIKLAERLEEGDSSA